MGVKGLTPCYNPVSQVILCFTLMISELVFTLYWKHLIHTRISNPFLKCFLPSKYFFFFFQTGVIIVDNCKLAVAVNFGTNAAFFPCATAQHSNFKLKMNWKITGTFLCECTPSERQSGWVLRVLARCLGCWLGAWVPASCLGHWTCNLVVQGCSSPLSYLLDFFSLSSTPWFCSVWLPFTSWES